ncbi:unnamed protein product [Thelazia callipaeda]|uniref:BHLH domain-containing protein n=1 Tax=Thelazia callipaeda TaxID=103827 RepID=A0A0N5DB48_THECL|nr:unnamed protein product [Thelazia callipaeda]
MPSKISTQEPIHSGHFMTSNPHSDEFLPDEDPVGVDVVDDVVEELEDDEQKGQDLRELNVHDEKPVTFYKFGPKRTQSIAIDVSLNKLNKCIKVAYNKMTTPKWKDFKGLRLHWKQRIRLNNVIWRAYYMEFRRPDKDKSKKTPYCYFSVPDDDATHVRLEGAVMEGMYWKRGLDALKAQYKRWRHFRTSRRGKRRGISWSQDITSSRHLAVQNSMPQNSSVEQPDVDSFENEFTDSLFASLMQPYTFPNPKEITQSCNADVMQPGLLSLQPSIEEIMASLDPPDQLSHEIGNLDDPDVSPPPSSTPKLYETRFSSFVNPTQQPTRQSSDILPQSLLANSSAPTYSQAAYDHTPLIATTPFTSSDSAASDYVPQFLTSPIQSSSLVPSSRSWWINFPATPSSCLLGNPSTTVTHTSPTAPSPLSINTSATALLIPTVERNHSSTTISPLSIYSNSVDSGRIVNERWNTAGPSTSSLRKFSVSSVDRGVWKQLSHAANVVNEIHSLPVPQPLYPQVSSQIVPGMASPLSHVGSKFITFDAASAVKMEHEKDDRMHRFHKRSIRSVAADSTIEPVERKRILHLNAEQNRRFALKDGFDQLVNLLPNLYGSGTKPTNAVVLVRAAERIRELKANIERNHDKAKKLKDHIQRLNSKIETLQASLPSSSGTVISTITQKTEIEQFLLRYTKERTREDYRFWIMAKMLQPLLEILIGKLSELPADQALVGTSDWLREHWQPSVLRPYASSMLVYLATHTSILTDPTALREYIQKELSRL